MKLFLKIIGLTLFIVIIIAGIGTLIYRHEKRTAAEFATDAVNDISVAWQIDELKKRAHPTMLENIAKSGHPIEEYFTVLSKLGALKKVIDCSLIHSGVTNFPSFNVSADYICHGEYEASPATLVIGLVQERLMGPWQIVNFQIDSPIFASNSKQKKMDRN